MGVGVGEEVEEVAVNGGRGSGVVVFALCKETFETVEHCLAVVFVEGVVVLAVLLLEVLLDLFRYFLHILFVEERQFLCEDGDDVPDVGDASVVLETGEQAEGVFEEVTGVGEGGGEYVFGDVLDVADESLFVDLRDAASLLKSHQRAGDEFGVEFEGLLQQAVDYLLAVHVEDVLKVFFQELLEGQFDLGRDFILQQRLDFINPGL